MQFKLQPISPAGSTLWQVVEIATGEDRGTFKSKDQAEKLLQTLNSGDSK